MCFFIVSIVGTVVDQGKYDELRDLPTVPQALVLLPLQQFCLVGGRYPDLDIGKGFIGPFECCDGTAQEGLNKRTAFPCDLDVLPESVGIEHNHDRRGVGVDESHVLYTQPGRLG